MGFYVFLFRSKYLHTSIEPQVTQLLIHLRISKHNVGYKHFNLVYYFRFFKLILQLISRYQTWAEDANVKSKTDLKNFSTRIKFLEDLESDLNIFYFKLNDIYFMFEELLRIKVPADILELQKSKCFKHLNHDLYFHMLPYLYR